MQSFINHIAGASTDILVKEVLQGRYGNGKIREIVLGSRYQAVQNRINGAQYYTCLLYTSGYQKDTTENIILNAVETIKRKHLVKKGEKMCIRDSYGWEN